MHNNSDSDSQVGTNGELSMV